MKEQQDRAGIKRNWPDYEIEGVLGHGAYGQVYKIKREYLGNTTYSALKVIHIPPNEDMGYEMKSWGMSEEKIKEYYKELVQNFLNENTVMEKLKSASNIVTIEDCIVEKDAEGDGYTIYIKMELLISLDSMMMDYKLGPDDIVTVGRDICDALIACEQMNIVHRDIKPANIFLNSFGTFKLGDFGVAKQMQHTQTGMTQIGTVMYMAPELYRGETADKRVDIYSLGIMLYRIANEGCFPFVDPNFISPTSNQDALLRRLKGEELPLPSQVDEELGRIIVKACAHKADDRYGSAKELKDALEAWSVKKKYGKTVGGGRHLNEEIKRKKEKELERARKEQEMEEARKRVREERRIRELEEKNRKQEEELNRLRKQQQEAELERQREEKEEEPKKQAAEKQRQQTEWKRQQETEKQRQERLKQQEAEKQQRENEKNHSVTTNSETGLSKKRTPVGAIIMVILAVCVVIGAVLASQNAKSSADNNETISGKASVTNEELHNSEVKVGDTVKFGTYDNSDIQWKVLDKEGDKALLITEDCLLDKEYNEEYESVTWENCTLRNWLNNDFYNASFSETERKQIVETTLTNPDNPLYSTEGGNGTKDKVFLLSIDEANEYFSSDVARKATYADGSSAWWWLRSPGNYASYAAIVSSGGYVGKIGDNVDGGTGVRPALWVNLDSGLF